MTDIVEENPRLVLDPREYGVQEQDYVQFSRGGNVWLVNKVGYGRNLVYVTSLVGKRRAIEQLSQVVSVRRDPTYIPEAMVDYDADEEEDYA